MLKYFSNLCFHYVCCYFIGQSKFQGQLKFQGWRKILPLCWKSFKIIPQWHAYKGEKILWPFLHSATDILKTPNTNGYFLYFWKISRIQTLLTASSNYSYSKPLFSLLLTGTLLSHPCPLCNMQQPEQTKKWSDHVPPVFKTFHWLLISFRIKFKFPLEVVRLYMIQPFLWLEVTLLLTHPIPAILGFLLFLKYTKHALASRLCICCFLPDT